MPLAILPDDGVAPPTERELRIAAPTVKSVTAGRMTVRWGPKCVDVAAGETIFLSPGKYALVDDEPENRAVSITFEPAAVARFRARHPELAPAGISADRAFKVRSTPFVRSSLESLPLFLAAHTRATTPLAEHKLEELILSLVDADARVWPVLRLASSQDTSLFTYIESHRESRRLVVDLATGAGHSVSTFKRKFRSVTGSAPARWLRVNRLERARVLVETTRRSITDIALEVGFVSVSHFVQAFRRQFHSTPLRLRKLQTMSSFANLKRP